VMLVLSSLSLSTLIISQLCRSLKSSSGVVGSGWVSVRLVQGLRLDDVDVRYGCFSDSRGGTHPLPKWRVECTIL
jgi:hypothetical protein